MEIEAILVPFDFGEPSFRALEYAKAIGDRFGSSLEVLHVVPDPYLLNPCLPLSPEAAGGVPSVDAIAEELAAAERHLHRVLDPIEGLSVSAWSTVRIGDPRAVILEHAAQEKVSLIVMGTHGRKGAARLVLGSVAEKVVRMAPCPVLTIR